MLQPSDLHVDTSHSEAAEGPDGHPGHKRQQLEETTDHANASPTTRSGSPDSLRSPAGHSTRIGHEAAPLPALTRSRYEGSPASAAAHQRVIAVAMDNDRHDASSGRKALAWP